MAQSALSEMSGCLSAFGGWSQAVDATLYLRRKRRSGWAMGRRYVRGFNAVAKEELWNRWRCCIRSSTEWLGNSMNGRARLWASKPELNDLMLVLHRPIEPTAQQSGHSRTRDINSLGR